MDKKSLEEKYVGKRVRVTFDDPYSPCCGKEGIVNYVDDIGQLHGTWGGLAAIPDADLIEIIG